MTNVEGFAKALGHEFKDPRLAVEALTHSSLVNEPAGRGRTANTRQEFIGDAVVELAVRAILADRFPQAPSGRLDQAKQAIVENPALAEATRALGLSRFLERGGSRPPDSDDVVAQLYEAAIGAVFLDAGFDVARGVVERQLRFPHSI